MIIRIPNHEVINKSHLLVFCYINIIVIFHAVGLLLGHARVVRKSKSKHFFATVNMVFLKG